VNEHPEVPSARAHPGAILGVWAWQAGVALVASWPAASLLRAAYGADPRGDAALWASEGRALLDLFWRGSPGVTAAVDGALLVLLAGALGGLAVLAALMTILAHPQGPRSLPRAVHGSVRALPAFVACGIVVGASQAAVLGAGAFCGVLSEGWAHAGLGEAPAEAIGVAAGLPFAALAVGLGVAHDLARAAVIARRTTGLRGLVVGFRTFRAAPLALSWSWGWRAAASLAPVALASGLAGRLGGRGGPALLVLAAAHQGVVLSRVALRASWLARALRAVTAADRRAQPAESER
jgi:hypothetical protein